MLLVRCVRGEDGKPLPPVDTSGLDCVTGFQVRAGLSYCDYSKEHDNIAVVHPGMLGISRKMRQFGKRSREEYEESLREEDEDAEVAAAIPQNPVRLTPAQRARCSSVAVQHSPCRPALSQEIAEFSPALADAHRRVRQLLLPVAKIVGDGAGVDVRLHLYKEEGAHMPPHVDATYSTKTVTVVVSGCEKRGERSWRLRSRKDPKRFKTLVDDAAGINLMAMSGFGKTITATADLATPPLN